VLRFLGKRYPVDYNKLPFLLYWSLHLVWLFPWSIYLPVVLRQAWSARNRWLRELHGARYSAAARSALFRARTTWLLAIYAAVILLFFSISTNQEYYTFPVYFPLLLLTAAALASEEVRAVSNWLVACQVALAFIGLVAAAALGYGLWSSRGLPSGSDIGALLAHRDVAGYLRRWLPPVCCSALWSPGYCGGKGTISRPRSA
jgi:hypothetical protein